MEGGKRFAANTDTNSRVKNLFVHPVLARYVRILPTNWYSHISMRGAVAACVQDCQVIHMCMKYVHEMCLSAVCVSVSVSVSMKRE